MSRKKQKVSHECVLSPDFCYRSSSEKVLSDLPDEILTMIFGYLTPESLTQISSLRIQRLTGAACFKLADFSTCNTINLEDLQSFFIEERLNLIEEINFNNVFFVLPSTLTSCIVKCKKITKLHVFNCGLRISNIGSIFNSCKALQECYWSLPEDDNTDFSNLSGISNSLKKICIQIEDYDPQFNIRFLDMCPNVEEVCINYTHQYIVAIPAKLSTRYFCFKTIIKDRDILYNIVLSYVSDTCPRKMKIFLLNADLREDASVDELEKADKTQLGYLLRNGTLVQLFADKEGLEILPQYPDESIESLVIFMNTELYIMTPHMNRINRMTGKALNHFSLCKHESRVPTPTKMVDRMEYFRISEVLCGVIEHSINITELNLSELHFLYIFPLPTDCALKNLKVFNVCACCLAVPERERERSEIQNMVGTRLFRDFILNCKKVEEFGLYGCNTCSFGPTDEQLIPISLWKELKFLTLECVKTVRQGQFLTHVANMCPHLKTVELIHLSEPKLCHFTPSVVQILKKSKELIFLRINQPGFYPMDSLFWKSVGSAQNLQGLCISTTLTTYIENKPILEAISKLPYFNLFHLMAKGTCFNLKAHIKRILTDKGVKISHIRTQPGIDQSLDVCPFRHFALY